MIKDRDQKDMIYRHFRAQGWMAQLEVPIVSERGLSASAVPVTDIDVLGFRPSAELKWQLVVGDCKTRRKESPVNRVLWVRGLQEALGAVSSIVILRREAGAPIERDHKLFADRLGVLLIQEDEFAAYDRAVVYPAGSSAYEESADVLTAIRSTISEKFPALRDFVQWVMCHAWSIHDQSVVLRRLLGRVREVRGEFDPRREDHVVLLLETASAIAIPLATLVGEVFRGHLKPDQRTVLEEAIRIIVWGGREQYDFFNALRRQVIAVKKGDSQEELALPAWDHFLELVRGYLEAPHLAFRTPQLLRSTAVSLMLGDPNRSLSCVSDVMLLHLTLRVALYVCRAAELPQDAADKLRQIFTPRITELTHASSVGRHLHERQEQVISGEKREENA